MLVARWFLAALIGAAVAVSAVGVAFGVRRRRLRRAGLAVRTGWRLAVCRLTLLLATLVFASAAVAAGVNDHYSYIPSFHALFGDVSPDLVSHPVGARSARPSTAALLPVATNTDKPHKPADHGTVEKVSVNGPVSGIEARDTYVYLPPQYFDPDRRDQRFPVLYLLHGSPGVSIDWIRAGSLDRTMDDLLAKHGITPFIVVMPDFNGGFGRDTECEDIPGGPRTQTYLVTDVVHYVDANYRTIPNRGARVLGGLSTGGYCAINLVLRHQDVFSGIVAHSGYDRPDHNLYTGDLFGSDRQAERANTPSQYLPAIPLTKPLGVYIDVGASDSQSRVESIELQRIFERRGIRVDFHDFPDEAHTWSAWRRNLAFSLPWVSSWFGSAPVPQPPGTPSLSASGSIVSAAPLKNSSSSSRGTGLSSSQWSTHSSTMAIHPRKTNRRPGGSSEKPRAPAIMSTTAARVSSKTASRR
jgi:enterochelin esterase-like enzyme